MGLSKAQTRIPWREIISLVAATLLILSLMPVFYLIFYGRKYKKEQKMNEANMA